MACILVHGSGHKATSWNEAISYMKSDKEILCPNLYTILNGQEANYVDLYTSFARYCNDVIGQIDLCGLSLGGMLALNYTLDFPEKVKTLVIIGTPHKIPKILFSIQNIIFKFLPKSIFKNMEFSKKDTLILVDSMKEWDLSSKVQNIKCPTLVICGKKDRENIKSAYFLAKNIKNAKLKIIENTGHIVNEENPKSLAKELDDYYLLNTI